ncbi:MAG TPA: sigma-70 family RNA polymerase sigma factor [Rhodothermales bacterium]|nr:sigma-70 family RNA polymerase sigma factor [Rhodothermales bacterium]
MNHKSETPPSREAVTQLLLAYEQSDGSNTALECLLPLLYDGLRAMAHRHLRKERADHTLNTTALVHEAYLKLADQTQLSWKNELHFYGIASRVMRNILIDYARLHRAQKRGGGIPPTSLDDKNIAIEERAEELLALDQALTRLSSFDERLGKIVEYRFFGGLTIAETAALLDTSETTIKREWRRAKAWLFTEMQ